MNDLNTKAGSFESDSLRYESFNNMFNIQNTDLNKIFYSEVISKASSISSMIDSNNSNTGFQKNKNHQLTKRKSYMLNRFSNLFNPQFCSKTKRAGVLAKTKSHTKSPHTKTVTSYEFLKKTLPVLIQSDIYEPVKAIENLYSQIYSVVKLPSRFQKNITN